MNKMKSIKYFRDTDFLSVYDGCITCDVTRKLNSEHKLMAHCISSKFGITRILLGLVIKKRLNSDPKSKEVKERNLP